MESSFYTLLFSGSMLEVRQKQQWRDSKEADKDLSEVEKDWKKAVEKNLMQVCSLWNLCYSSIEKHKIDLQVERLQSSLCKYFKPFGLFERNKFINIVLWLWQIRIFG